MDITILPREILRVILEDHLLALMFGHTSKENHRLYAWNSPLYAEWQRGLVNVRFVLEIAKRGYWDLYPKLLSEYPDFIVLSPKAIRSHLKEKGKWSMQTRVGRDMIISILASCDKKWFVEFGITDLDLSFETSSGRSILPHNREAFKISLPSSLMDFDLFKYIDSLDRHNDKYAPLFHFLLLCTLDPNNHPLIQSYLAQETSFNRVARVALNTAMGRFDLIGTLSVTDQGHLDVLDGYVLGIFYMEDNLLSHPKNLELVQTILTEPDLWPKSEFELGQRVECWKFIERIIPVVPLALTNDLSTWIRERCKADPMSILIPIVCASGRVDILSVLVKTIDEFKVFWYALERPFDWAFTPVDEWSKRQRKQRSAMVIQSLDFLVRTFGRDAFFESFTKLANEVQSNLIVASYVHRVLHPDILRWIDEKGCDALAFMPLGTLYLRSPDAVPVVKFLLSRINSQNPLSDKMLLGIRAILENSDDPSIFRTLSPFLRPPYALSQSQLFIFLNNLVDPAYHYPKKSYFSDIDRIIQYVRLLRESVEIRTRRHITKLINTYRGRLRREVMKLIDPST